MKKKNDKDEWFIIDDLSKFVESTRVLVFDAFGNENKKSVDELSMMLSELEESEIEEIEKTLTQAECLVIAQKYLEKQTNKITKKERYIISTKKYLEMIESFNARMISNLLSHLVSQGFIESAFDTETNDFIFWIKDNVEENKNKEQKPETD
jgi:GTPase involved in cell partitioning and DNA repair